MPDEESKYERERLLKAIEVCGFPYEFGEMLADQLGGPWSMQKMTGFLYQAKPKSVESIADELLAILEQRRSIVEKSVTEASNAGWNLYLNRPDEENCDN